MRLIAPLIVLLCLLPAMAFGSELDVAINNGRVIDPETGLDQVISIGIRGDKITEMSTSVMQAREVIDASGLVVAPGFIDLHSHSPTPLGQLYQAFDGVTTALELEAGHYPIDEFGDLVSEAPLINYGTSVGYGNVRLWEKNGLSGYGRPKPVSIKGVVLAIRSLFMDELAAVREAMTEPVDSQELESMKSMLEQSLDDGALGIGLPLDYFSEAIQANEMEMLFSLAGEYGAPIFVHIRRGVDGDPTGLEEVIEYARRYQAPLHVCHITHSAISGIEEFLALIREAREDGVDISTEVLPFNAGSTFISAAVFSRDWQRIFGIGYEDVQWARTGEYFESQEMWHEYQENDPQGTVIHHYLKEAWTQLALREESVIVVSDLLSVKNGTDFFAPHNGAFAKVLGEYVRETELLDLSEAIARMSLLPAKRLESYVPAFRTKGRIQPGMDADITIFDPETIINRATYEDPHQKSEGVEYLLVNGRLVIYGGQMIDGVGPGKRLAKSNNN